jgi:hypothetical protein
VTPLLKVHQNQKLILGMKRQIMLKLFKIQSLRKIADFVVVVVGVVV